MELSSSSSVYRDAPPEEWTRRVCVDATPVNPTVRGCGLRDPHLHKSLQSSGNSKRFCKVDLAGAYLQLVVADDGSREMLVSRTAL